MRRGRAGTAHERRFWPELVIFLLKTVRSRKFRKNKI